jgi:large subunit ribosomal protein L20
MGRVKGGFTTHRRHKKVLDAVKGHSGSRHRRFKIAKESLIHALAYSSAHRRSKKRDQRSLMITRVNAAARKCGISYSQLIHCMKESQIDLDRKALSLLAYNDFSAFEKVVEEAKISISSS